MADRDLTKLTACAQRGLLSEGKVSARELVESAIDAVGRVNERVNAVITLAEDQALDAADRADARQAAGERLGALHGLPIVVKDITETAGIRTTFCSPLCRENIPDRDADVVARLKRAGAIVLGKTNTPEFAAGANTVNSVFGATVNPWDTNLSASGSSGGSAVAVASHMVPLGHGTDFGCSLRMPASFCGIVGLRTTPGLIPNKPMVGAWDPGQVHGPLARTAEDAALMLDGMVGFDPTWPISVPPSWKSAREIIRASEDIRDLRICYAPDIAGIGVQSSVAQTCKTAVNQLVQGGAQICEVPFELSDGIAPYAALRAQWMVEQQLARLSDMDKVDPNLARNVEMGLAQTPETLAEAQHGRDAMAGKIGALFADYDIMLTPTSPVEPFPVDDGFPKEINGQPMSDYTGWMAPCFLLTLVSAVSASVPAGITGRGLPVGLQVVGPRLSEPQVLRVVKALQSTIPMPKPGVCAA